VIGASYVALNCAVRTRSGLVVREPSVELGSRRSRIGYSSPEIGTRINLGR
jgi:hypothetical protein